MPKPSDISKFDPPSAGKVRRVRIPRARSDATASGLVEALRGGALQTFMGLDLPAVEIGERIRAARLAREMTQSELARRVGCQQSDLSDIERGEGKEGPRYATLRRIAQALDIELPINPAPDPQIEVMVLGGKGEGAVIQSAGRHEAYRALFTPVQWSSMTRDVTHHTDNLGVAPFSHCVILQVEPASKALIRSPDATVLARVKGAGKIHVTKARFRKNSRAALEPMIAVLGDGSQVEIQTEAEGLTLMVMPSALFFEQEEDA